MISPPPDEISPKLALALAEAEKELTPLNREQAKELMDRAEFGGLGLPYFMNRALVESGEARV